MEQTTLTTTAGGNAYVGPSLASSLARVLLVLAQRSPSGRTGMGDEVAPRG
jgi:hypothetical protein